MYVCVHNNYNQRKGQEIKKEEGMGKVEMTQMQYSCVKFSKRERNISLKTTS